MLSNQLYSTFGGLHLLLSRIATLSHRTNIHELRFLHLGEVIEDSLHKFRQLHIIVANLKQVFLILLHSLNQNSQLLFTFLGKVHPVGADLLSRAEELLILYLNQLFMFVKLLRNLSFILRLSLISTLHLFLVLNDHLVLVVFYLLLGFMLQDRMVLYDGIHPIIDSHHPILEVHHEVLH